MIQAMIRGSLAALKYREFVLDIRRCEESEASICIQKMLRGHFAKKRLQRVLSSVIMIQSIIRANLARKQFILQQISHAQEELAVLRSKRVVMAAIAIQRQWRSLVEQERFSQTRISAIILQSAFRRFFAIRLRSKLAAEVHQASTVLQDQHTAASKIQCVYRQIIAKRLYEKLSWQRINISAINIQTYWRGCVAREKYNKTRVAAILIQSQWRSHALYDEFNRALGAAIIMQSVIRRFLIMMEVRNCQLAASQIQRLWRLRTKIRDIELRQYHRAVDSSIVIQSLWRGSVARESYSCIRGAVITIQAVVRGVQVRDDWWFVRFLVEDRVVFDAAARKIQITYAVFILKLSVWEMKSLAVLLQRGVRGQLERSAVRYALMHVNLCMHSRVLDTFDRVVSGQEGVSTIVAWNRAVADARTSAAIVIQSFARQIFVRNEIYRNYGVLFQAAHTNSEVAKQRDDATLAIQMVFRNWVTHRSQNAIEIQKIVRGWIARTRFQILFKRQQLSAV